jgi:hypothetical protein
MMPVVNTHLGRSCVESRSIHSVQQHARHSRIAVDVREPFHDTFSDMSDLQERPDFAFELLH